MDRRALFVTGAASGIGRAAAARFARAGGFVGAGDVDAAGLEALAAELGGQEAVLAEPLDVTDPAAVRAAFERFGAATGGRLDVLLNCAGAVAYGPFEETEEAAYRRVVDVNVNGVVSCLYHALPLLRATPGARVVTVSSAAATYGMPDLAVYGATKQAVRGLTQALALEWARHGIHVCDVMPPFVDTPMFHGMLRGVAETPPAVRRMGILTVEDVVATIWAAATGPRRVHWPVGRRYRALYALSGVTPPPLAHRVIGWMTGR